MLRVPTWSMSACSATTFTSRASTISVTIGRPVTSRTSERISRPFTPRPWKAYGEVRGLNAPPRSSLAPAALAISAASRVCCGGLDGARAGDEGERLGADRDLVALAADVDGRALGVVLAADQLVGVGDPVDVLDAGHAAQVEAVEGLDVADQADDRARHAAADERLPTRLLDPLGDVRDLLLGGAGSHHNDHAVEARCGVRMAEPISSIRYQTAMCGTSASIRRRGTSSTISIAASTSAPPSSIRERGGLAAQQHREERGEDRLHAHDDRGPRRRQVRLRPGLAEQRGGSGDQRHVDDREPVAGPVRQHDPARRRGHQADHGDHHALEDRHPEGVARRPTRRRGRRCAARRSARRPGSAPRRTPGRGRSTRRRG